MLGPHVLDEWTGSEIRVGRETKEEGGGTGRRGDSPLDREIVI